MEDGGGWTEGYVQPNTQTIPSHQSRTAQYITQLVHARVHDLLQAVLQDAGLLAGPVPGAWGAGLHPQ